MSMPLNRRILLRGLGGACIAAPLLSSLSDRGARAAPAPPPRRLIAMFTHYGCVTNRFFPTKSHGALGAADLQSTSLAPLVPYVDQLLIPRGIRAMNEWTPTLIRGQGNDQDLNACGTYFTCQPVTPNGDDPFSFNVATKFNAMPIGRSLDHVIAEQLSPGGLPLYMRVGNRPDNGQGRISYSASETPYEGYGTPGEAFSKLTGLFTPNTPMSPDSFALARGKSMIDIVRHDLDTLERMDMSKRDRLKLEAWKALLDDTGKVATTAQCSQARAVALGATPMNVDAAGMADPKDDPLMIKISDSMDGADVYSAVAVLAAVCNQSPVVFLNYPVNYIFKGLGLTIESHSLSHRIADASMSGLCLANAIDMLLKIDGYYAQKFAKLIGMLNDIPEGDGKTALDNSAAVWFQEFSDGNAHNLNNIPIIQAGSAGGYFKTGWAINVEDGSATLSKGNSESSCPAGTQLDDGADGTGTDPKYANAPINKYFCNLMNAVGVRAGADGFPAKNGTAEVTKYGRYDKTEDFVHGGTAPPAINNPGEFDALKANP
ncbi:MAG TPA: DUF1552 domain-containing protein [Polyangiaceae bacterium]|nr:DUF1552 domain-containing protein [Polyangiaceae bacterium]